MSLRVSAFIGLSSEAKLPSVRSSLTAWQAEQRTFMVIENCRMMPIRSGRVMLAGRTVRLVKVSGIGMCFGAGAGVCAGGGVVACCAAMGREARKRIVQSRRLDTVVPFRSELENRTPESDPMQRVVTNGLCGVVDVAFVLCG